MPTLSWRNNLRGNLVLWPTPRHNISVLLRQHGSHYDEDEFLSQIQTGQSGDGPSDTRSVRNTMEVLLLSGMASRSRVENDQFRLTTLGATASQFFGVNEERSVANENSLILLGIPFLRGLLAVVEYREIWGLMTNCDGRLSNEELNRFMRRANTPNHYLCAYPDVVRAREQQDPTLIGPRYYEEESFGIPARRSDQRKAMNPWFLLASAGWVLMNQRSSEDPEMRTARPWALEAAAEILPRTEAVTSISDPNVCQIIDAYSFAPRPTKFINYAY